MRFFPTVLFASGALAGLVAPHNDFDVRAPEPTAAAAAADILGNNLANIFGRATDTIQGNDCVAPTSSEVEACKTVTLSDGKQTTTSPCSKTMATSFTCKQGFTCTFNAEAAVGGTRMCMALHNNLDTAGIIIAIIMAVGTIAGIVTITYLCIQNKKEQKRLTAKAEATALARAATKKKRAAERAPLMNQPGASAPPTAGAGDPFADRNRS